MFRLFTINQGYRASTRLIPTVQKRNHVHVAELHGTYKAFIEKKHLSPLHGAAFSLSKAIDRLYDLSLLDEENTSATSQLVTALFYKIANEFRVTQSKSLPAYSLNPSLIADIIYHLDANTLDNIEVIKTITGKWKQQHILQTGSKISTDKIQKLLKHIIESKKECLLNQFPATLTETILLSFLHQKAKSRQEVIAYLNALNEHTHSIDATQIKKSKRLNQRYIRSGNKLINDIDSKKSITTSERLLDKNEEKVLLTLLLNNGKLNRVTTANYGYQGEGSVPNCTEVSFHNFCNILLFNQETCLFDFSLLPSTLNPHEKLIDIYKMESFMTDRVNSQQVGQAFMDLLSANPEFIYVRRNYELETTEDNFIPVVNYLFGTQATTLDELSKLFSDDNRKITFEQEENIISIYIDSNRISTPNNYITFTFTNDHCEFEATSFANSMNNLSSTSNLSKLAIQKFSVNPMLFTLLHELYLAYFPTDKLIASQIGIEKINDYIFNNFPHNSHEAYRLIELMLPYHTTYPHLATHIKLLINRFGFLLADAAHKDSLPMTVLLLKYGANPNIDLHENGHSVYPILCAHNINVIDLLLNAGADPNVEDQQGHTALHYHADNPVVVKRLLLAGADVNAKDNYGDTPLCRTRHPEVAKLLIEHGAQIELPDQDFPMLFYHLDSLEIVQLLLAAGIDPDITNERGETALFYCKNTEVIHALVKAGANPNALNQKGSNALYFARNAQVAQALIDVGTDPHIMNINDRTAIDAVSTRSNILLQTTADEIIEVIERAKKKSKSSFRYSSSFE